MYVHTLCFVVIVTSAVVRCLIGRWRRPLILLHWAGNLPEGVWPCAHMLLLQFVERVMEVCISVPWLLINYGITSRFVMYLLNYQNYMSVGLLITNCTNCGFFTKLSIATDLLKYLW